MKLYTEEQVKQIAKQIMNYGFHDVSDFKNYDTPILPIELPSDEEIEEYCDDVRLEQYYIDGAIDGAKWMRDKILNQNK